MDPCVALSLLESYGGISIDWVILVKMEMKQEMYREKHSVDHSVSLFTPISHVVTSDVTLGIVTVGEGFSD